MNLKQIVDQKKLIEKIALKGSVFYEVQREAEILMVTEPCEWSPQVVGGGLAGTGARATFWGLGHSLS